MTDWTVPIQIASLESFRWTALRRVALVFLVLLAVAACDRAADPISPQLVEGQPFPSSMLDIVSNRPDVAASLKGKMLVLNLWATWCPPCRHEMPGLNRLSRVLDPSRFVVIGVSVDSDALLVTEYLFQNGITFANLLDKNGKIARQLGVQAYPETFVIAPDHTLVRRMSGQHEWGSPDMVKLLEELYRAHQRTNHEQR